MDTPNKRPGYFKDLPAVRYALTFIAAAIGLILGFFICYLTKAR